MFPSVLASLLLVALASAARIKKVVDIAETDLYAKTGEGDTCNIYISYNESFNSGTTNQGNDVGRVVVTFPSGAGQFTNQGFLQYPAQAWQNGMILGKADEYIWAIPPQGGVASFTFDHGVSDLVFGDVSASGMYRAEFEEVIYQNPNMQGGYGAMSSTPQQAVQKQLAEEQKESTLKFGTWQRDGYFTAQRGGGQLRYTPRLKVKDGSSFQTVGKLGSSFQSAVLQRPSIMDIDNLFSVKPTVPSTLREAGAVQGDMSYQGGYNQGGYNPHGGRMQPHGGMPMNQGGYNQPTHGGRPQQSHSGMPMNQGPTNGGMPRPNNGGYNAGGYNAGGYNAGGMQQPGRHVNSQCYPKQGSIMDQARAALNKYCGRTNREQCATQQECSQIGGRWKNQYCAGGYGCGCCKDIPMRQGYLETDSSVNDTSQSDLSTQALPVQIDVQWLTPVLQKFQCVSVASQYAKVGGMSLFIAMGWDTESGVADLDLDLSLVPVDKMKRVIPHKRVWYNTKAPQPLQCGYNQYAMQAFVDDRSGDEPGDDELVKVNLGCLGQHSDVEAFVIVVNIYQPQQLSWSQIDSAYMRIISGGQELAQGGNFFIRSAEAVRSFIRLSGNDLKADPELQKNGLAVGIFFRQEQGNWAFASLMKGIPGRNVDQSGPHLERVLQDLVYPANTQWDKTQEQQALNAQGAFGEAGIHGKASVAGLVSSGQLPCVASKADQARIMMGHMTPEALGKVQQNPNLPQDVKKFAGIMQQKPNVAKQMQGMAQAVDKMEKAGTEEERKQIAGQIKTSEPTPPTQEESREAEEDLADLFDTV